MSTLSHICGGFNVRLSYIICPFSLPHWLKSGIVFLFRCFLCFQVANIFLKLFHFALKNSPISILQTHSIIWPAALLYNSPALAKVCIVTAKKDRKDFVQIKLRLHRCTNAVSWSRANLFVQSFDEWCSETAQRDNWSCVSHTDSLCRLAAAKLVFVSLSENWEADPGRIPSCHLCCQSRTARRPQRELCVCVCDCACVC